MNDKILYLHIGTEKTGTTSVQKFFHQHRSMMEENYSLLYPKFGYSAVAQFELVAAIHEMSNGGRKAEFAPNVDYNPEETWEQFCSQVRATKCKKVFVSVEHFSSRLNEEGVKFISTCLKNNLPEFKVVILVYLRNQVDMLQSSYSTYIKTGGVKSVFEYINNIKEADTYCNYFNLITLWAKYFGHEAIITRNFNLLDKQKGVVGDILETINIPTTDFTFNVNSNKTWNPVFLEFCRIINAGDLYKMPYTVRCDIYKKILKKYEHFSRFDDYSLLPQERINHIKELFSESNKKVALLLKSTQESYFPERALSKKPYDYSKFNRDLSFVLFASIADIPKIIEDAGRKPSRT